MHSLGCSAEALAEAEDEEGEVFCNPMPQVRGSEMRGEGGIMNGMMAWAPAAARVQGFLQGGDYGRLQVAADLAAIRSPLGGHPEWRRMFAAAELALRERQLAAAPRPVNGGGNGAASAREAAKRRRHAENAAARAVANHDAAKSGGAGTKKKGGR